MFKNLNEEEQKLDYNYLNKFQSQSKKEYVMKTKKIKTSSFSLDNYNVKPDGVKIGAQDEMGFFKFGSTIVLIFSANKDQELDFKFKEGDVVKIGQSLVDYRSDSSKVENQQKANSIKNLM